MIDSTPAVPASGVDLGVGLVGVVVIAGVASVVHRDARRVGFERPGLWAGIVAATCAVGLVTYLLVPTVPVPGLLVVVLAGPALYLFERDDVKHGEEPADPHTLPTDAGDRSAGRSDERPDE